MPDRKIAVVGAGANGAAIGADLTAAGLDVVLIEQWPAHVEAMRDRGLTVRLPTEVRVVPVRVLHLCEVAELNSPFDVVLMLMKSYDTRWAAHLIEPYLAPDGLLVGVQNGLTVDVITEVVGDRRTIGCVIEVSSMMFEPGVVERHSPRDRSWFAIGALTDDMRARVDEVGSLLGVSGTVEVVDDIRAAKWMKLVSNASTLVPSAILGLPLLEAASIPTMRDVMVKAGREAMDAMTALGHAVRPIFGMSERSMVDETAVEQMFDWLLEGFVLPDTRTTVLQDWTKGRRSEVDDLNGLVVRTCEASGTPAPVNTAIVDVAHRIERRELDPDPSNLRELVTKAVDFGWSR